MAIPSNFKPHNGTLTYLSIKWIRNRKIECNCSGCCDSQVQKARRIEWVAIDRQAQSIQYSHTILASGRDVTADATKGPGTLHRAKTTRHLLLQLDRAQIALGQIVIERHLKIVHKSQHRALVFEQVIDQVPGRALLDPAALSGHWRVGWIGFQPLPDH